MDEVDKLRARIDDLASDLAKQKRINEVLVRRVERTIDDAGNAFALFERNTLLEHEVQARTRELERANTELTVANVAKSDFLANMSHELRTPLNAIMGMTSLMLGSSVSAEQREYLDIVRTSADALLKQIDDVLDFARLEAGRLELQAVPIDLCVAIEEVVDVLSVRAAEQGLELIARFTRKTPRYVVADPGRLRQVLMNLLGNALKFTDVGWVEVRATGRENNGRAEISIVVEDTGIGIEPEALPRIFDKFQQGDESITRRHSGTGLGLAITKQLVTLMGGTIAVESTLKKGSRFTVALTFPLVADHPPVPAPPLVVSGARLLVAADPSRASRALIQQLEDWSLQVEGVSLDDVVDRLRTGDEPRFDMVFVDEVPGGLSDERLTSIVAVGPRVCLLAERGTPARRAPLRDCDTVVWKPLRQTDLLRAVERISGDVAMEVGPADIANREGRALVLVVEDNDVNQHVAQRILERCGCDVRIANNGRTGVAAASEAAFDLVLMDIHMPVLDGFEAARSIRVMEMERSRDRVPIVAMTANVMSGIEVQCREAGMDDYISKPVRLDTIRAVLDAWVEAPTEENTS